MKLTTLVFVGLCVASTAAAQDINFGDDSGQSPRDGICEDRRFEGAAMALNLGWDNVGRDATDCSNAVDQGTASFWNMQDSIARTDCSAVNFGDNSSQYSNDGACDDPRFEGHGSAELPSDEYLGHDAVDCQRLCDFGLVFYRDMAPFDVVISSGEEDPYYGNDDGDFAQDGECDDRRFVGSGMAVSLAWGSTGRDATDCREAVEAGTITAWDPAYAASQTMCSEIDFGTDQTDYANNGTCDDFRFEGIGAAAHMISSDIGEDASDCRRMCDYGMIFVRDME